MGTQMPAPPTALILAPRLLASRSQIPPPPPTRSALTLSASLPSSVIDWGDLLTARGSRAQDVGYIATIQMGTPATDFKILMDSGSADLWVGSETCVSEAGGDCVRIIHPVS